MNQVKIVKISETRILDSRNNPVLGIQVTYTVGDHGPFTETGTKEDFLTGKIRQKIDGVAAVVRAQAPAL